MMSVKFWLGVLVLGGLIAGWIVYYVLQHLF